MHQHETDSEYLGKEPCHACGSKDNLARYSDGHGWCFGCGHYEKGDGDTEASPRRGKRMEGLIGGDIAGLGKRGIREETCKHFGYMIADFNGQKVQVAPYRDEDGAIVAQKLRFANKDFTVLGEMKKAMPLWGMWLWRDKGKRVVIVEGEIDCMSLSQVQDNRWPVVSVSTGAKGAKKNVAKALDWLEGFEEVVFMFDMDEPGQEAARECALLLTPGKAKIASLPLKDANEMLKAGRTKELVDATWAAKVYRPDGIVAGSELWEVVSTEDHYESVPYPWEGLNAMTRGQRQAELVTWTAGSGIGKSAVMREIMHHNHKRGLLGGGLFLEENVKRTGLGLMGIEVNRPLHITREGTTPEQLRAAFDATLGTGRLFLYDHFGSTEIDNLLSRIRYLAKACGCQFVVLDHLSIVISGMEDGDERRLIDNAMTMLRTLVQETGVGIHLVSHLKRPSGDKGHEQGAQVSLSQLRGSHAIAQLSDMVIGLERDQQGDTPNLTTVRVLKNRFTGETGIACYLKYDAETGRLQETDPAFAAENDPPVDESEEAF